MEVQDIIMPFKIKILKADRGPVVLEFSEGEPEPEEVDIVTALFSPYYNSYGELLVDIRPNYVVPKAVISEKMVIDFDSSRYPMMLNAHSIKEIRDCLKSFPDSCQFLSCDQPMIKKGTSEFLTIDQYSSLVKETMDGLRAFNSHYVARKKWDRLDGDELDELFDSYVTLVDTMGADLIR